MARFTSLEFMEALGLGYFDYNGAKILLRHLAVKGIAKEVGKVRPSGKGRPQTVYELPEEITLKISPTGNAPIHPPKKKRKKAAEEAEKITVAQIVEKAAEQEFEWDEGWDDD